MLEPEYKSFSLTQLEPPGLVYTETVSLSEKSEWVSKETRWLDGRGTKEIRVVIFS